MEERSERVRAWAREAARRHAEYRLETLERALESNTRALENVREQIRRHPVDRSGPAHQRSGAAARFLRALRGGPPRPGGVAR